MKIANTPLGLSALLNLDPAPQQALECLYEVVDPELGINIVDLGLVYDLEVRDELVEVVITMTTPACPLHSYITAEIEARIHAAMPQVSAVTVRLVWDPPWKPELMSQAARRELGWYE